MFTNLLNYQFKRTGKQAIGFYIAYLFLGILIGGLSAGIYALITGEGGFNTGVQIGSLVAVVFTLGLSTIIVIKKQIVSFKTVLLIIVSGVAALFIGGVGGLIPAAYLSTLSCSQNKQINMDA